MHPLTSKRRRPRSLSPCSGSADCERPAAGSRAKATKATAAPQSLTDIPPGSPTSGLYRLLSVMSTTATSSAGTLPPIALPDLKEEADKRGRDDQQGGGQPLAAELQLDHKLLALLDSLLCDHDRRVGEGLDPLHFDQMCFRPGLDQGIFRLNELKSRRTYLHACVLRPGQDRLGPVDTLGEVLEKGPDFVGLFKLRGVHLVAGGARGVLPSCQQLIRRLQNLVIAVASDACGLPQIAERLFVHALRKQLRRSSVAVAADIRHRIDPGRSGAVVPVAARAGGSRDITLLGQDPVMGH